MLRRAVVLFVLLAVATVPLARAQDPGSGTTPVAEITVKAVAAGRAVLTFDQAPGSTSSATLEVR